MMDSEALAIPEVELIIDSTKAEIVDCFKTINKKVESITREEGCRVGIFILCIGWRITELSLIADFNDKDVLSSLGAPLNNKNSMHDYQLTCQGEPVPIV